MRTFPDFTWDYIVEHCKRSMAEIHNPEIVGRAIALKFRWCQGVLAVVPLLREHPQLGQFVPRMSISTLMWFPAEDHMVGLTFDDEQSKYEVWVVKRIANPDVLEETTVLLEEVADAVYAYITKYG